MLMEVMQPTLSERAAPRIVLLLQPLLLELVDLQEEVAEMELRVVKNSDHSKQVDVEILPSRHLVHSVEYGFSLQAGGFHLYARSLQLPYIHVHRQRDHVDLVHLHCTNHLDPVLATPRQHCSPFQGRQFAEC